MQPFQLARRVGSDRGSARRHCLMRGTDRGLGHDVFSFSAAISACEKDVQWLRVAPQFVEMHRSGPWL
eukprot:8771506-Karenia_brevis.AAC.1